MRVLAAIILSCCVVACATSGPSSVEEAAQTWVGDPIDKLRGRWGNPQQVVELGDHQVYRYELAWRGTSRPTIAPSTSYGVTSGVAGGVSYTGQTSTLGTQYVPGQPIQRTCAVNFEVRQGVIVGFTTVGQDCRG